MLTLLRGLNCFCPEPDGEKDIVIGGSLIHRITKADEIGFGPLIDRIVDCRGLHTFPGLIDQHVHITGAGGEQGFQSRLREAEADVILNSGVTTVVGLLGADGVTRSMEALYAKAKGLESEGLTTYIYAGSYSVPPVTLTGSHLRDMVLIDKVIGAGEIALSDHRSSNPEVRDIVRLASEIHLGGLLSGKAGVVHLHVGDGKTGLGILKEVLASSDLPMGMFIPTHVNRNPELFRQAVDYCKNSGRIDLTAGERNGVSVAEAVRRLKAEDIDMSKVTVSSDAGGSIPGGGRGGIKALYDDFVEIIKQSILPPEQAIRLFSENPAAVLKLSPRKGALREGGDADILVTDSDCTIKMLYAMGKLMVDRIS